MNSSFKMEEEFHRHFNGLSFFSVLNVLWFVELKCGSHLQKVCHQLKQETTPASSECSRVNNSHQWMNCGQKKHSASVTARWLDSRKHYISPKRKGQQMRHTFEVFLSWTLKILILLSIQVLLLPEEASSSSLSADNFYCCSSVCCQCPPISC